MHCIYQRVGIFYRQSHNQNKKTFSIQYFILDNHARLHFAQTFSKISKVIRNSHTLQQIITLLNQLEEKSISLTKYSINGIKSFTNQGILPFTSRTYIQLRQKTTQKELRLIPIIQQEIETMLQLLKNSNEIKKQQNGRSSMVHLQKMKEIKLAQQLFSKYIPIESKFKLYFQAQNQYLSSNCQNKQQLNQPENQQKSVIQINSNLHYLGSLKQGIPQGQGKTILIDQGITYVGKFRNGKKHGLGYLVNSNLDIFHCQYIDDQITGI